MRCYIQGFILIGFMTFPLFAQSPNRESKLTYKVPKVMDALFVQGITMLGSEQDDYASNLTAYGLSFILNESESVSAMEHSRRVLALALHLSPRNKKAVVANYQLSKGYLPKPISCDYSHKVFARLLVTRGQLLSEAGGEKNELLARAFVTLAAEMDPLNEEAVFAAEMNRIDHGKFDWSLLTGE